MGGNRVGVDQHPAKTSLSPCLQICPLADACLESDFAALACQWDLVPIATGAHPWPSYSALTFRSHYFASLELQLAGIQAALVKLQPKDELVAQR